MRKDIFMLMLLASGWDSTAEKGVIPTLIIVVDTSPCGVKK